MSGCKHLLIVILLIFTITLLGEEQFLLDFNWDSVKNYNDYQKDFFYLCALLEESHPAFIEELGDDYQEKKQRVAGSLELVVSRQKLALILQQFVSQINDGHTQIYFEEDLPKLYLPMAFSWEGEQLVIANVNYGEDINLIGAPVNRIGNYSSKELEAKLNGYVSAENKYWKRVKLGQLLNNAGFLVVAGVMDEISELELEILQDGRKKIINLKPGEQVSWLKPKPHAVTAYNGKFFSYQILEKESICYFQFNQFQDSQTARIYHNAGLVSDSDYQEYQAYIDTQGGDFRIFLERMFNDIKKHELKSLVIDLRNNGGGNSILANQFYYHLAIDKPVRTFTTSIKLSRLMQHYYPDTVQFYLDLLQNDFGVSAELPYLFDLELETKEDYFELIADNKSDFYVPKPNYLFDGDIYFFTSNRTFSSAGDMVTIAYDNGLGTIIGEPMGQKPTSYGDILYFTLPHSNLDGGVSHKKFNRPSRNRNDEETIMPQYPVEVKLKEKYIKGIDRVWERTLELIKEQ